MANNNLLSKLEGIREHYKEIQQAITSPDAMSDMKRYITLNKDYKELTTIVAAAQKYETALSNLAQARDLMANEKDDDQMREMAREEIDELEPMVEKMEEDIKLLLIPADPEDSKNAIMEIRGGAGGDEAAIFAGDLMRMYLKFFERRGWKAEITSTSEGTSGGFKEIVIKVSGEAVYGVLKYESGVHRVQRVPQTETQGRIHTSAASVAVLPEADEFDVELNV
ncbi:MAG: PCRF domain-containing protein, partial [Mucinivorans sp.]